jgi:mannose-1-phosphate guanylyltransferase
MNWAVIMAGGVGERFWPLSRRKQPKQLQAIVTRRTMIQEAVARLRSLVPASRIVVVTNREQAPAVRRQLPGVKHILAEPAGRNTAPCIAWAAQYIERRDPQAVMAVVPSDSHIADVARYRQVVRSAFTLAGKENVLITVGIQPTRPATGYGYIQVGQSIGRGFWRGKRFVEKPDLATAKRFVATGQYRWNAGMFVWSAAAIREAFQRHAPGVWNAVQDNFAKAEKISVDYAIMEKAANVVVAGGDFDWDDVGDWTALARHTAKDVDGNFVRGPFVGVNATGNIILTGNDHLVGAVGVSGLVIVHTPVATLVCRQEDAQRVRELVRQLGVGKRSQEVL